MNIGEIINSLSEASKEKYVRFVADKGKNSCEKCLNYHERVFKADDPNKPQLPIHPNCRCKYVEVENHFRNDDVDIEQDTIIQNMKNGHDLSEKQALELASSIIQACNDKPKLRNQEIFLLFDGEYLMSSDGTFLVNAVSGKPLQENNTYHISEDENIIKHSEKVFNYSYARQGLENEGGIPHGLYSIETKGRSPQSSPISHLARNIGWGRYSWFLHPDKKTDVRERKGFFIHGGDFLGSAGCIDLQKNDIKLRDYLENTGLKSIFVYVKYKRENIVSKEEYNMTQQEKRRKTSRFFFRGDCHNG